MKKYLHIMVFFSAILVACSSKTSTTLSSDATVKRFYFAGDVRYPGLAEATFVVDDRVDTGWIYPKDSLKFGTRLDSVVPRFTFAAIPSSSLLTIGDRTLSLTGTDTLNFNQKPIYVTITAADGTAKKVYEISVYVHQIDPDLYVWEELATEITPPQPMEGKALMAERVFFYYTNDGFQNSLYTSANARVWTKESTPVGLPTDCRVRSICYVDTAETFYYADATGVYTSWDGINWSHDATPGYEPVTMLLSFNDEAWLLVRRTGETALHLATVDVLGEIKLRDDLLPRTIIYNLNPRDNALVGSMIGNFQRGPVAGKIQFGSGWWFNDQKIGMRAQLESLSQLGLLPRFVGMLTDSRSFMSYPRHEYFRRVLCDMLGSWMDAGDIPNDFGLVGSAVRDICYANAERYFGF